MQRLLASAYFFESVRIINESVANLGVKSDRVREDRRRNPSLPITQTQACSRRRL